MMCCPLQEADETCTVWNETDRRARKEHVCDECREPITRGELHKYITSLFDGHWDTYRMCLLCDEIGDHFSCGRGRIMQTLWSDLEENFFPDMSAGGPCMQGLSPAAKQKLIDARMKWYFDQDEINDDAWEFWPKYKDRQRPLRVVVEREEPVSYYDTPEYYWKRELELDKYRTPEDNEP
jgi:hypothetical protein